MRVRKKAKIHSAVDIWTGRLGLLNVAQLSDQFGRVIVWDDIRGDTTIPRSIGEIFRAIEMYYGFKPKIGTNATVHVGSIDGLARSTDAFFNTLDFSFLKMAHQRIAVVDLGSCGTTGLRWLDLIPLLRRCYSHIVGIDFSAPEFCGLDPEFKLPHGLTGPQQETLYACDYWLLASDKSISRQVDLSFEARSDALQLRLMNYAARWHPPNASRKHSAMRPLAFYVLGQVQSRQTEPDRLTAA